MTGVAEYTDSTINLKPEEVVKPLLATASGFPLKSIIIAKEYEISVSLYNNLSLILNVDAKHQRSQDSYGWFLQGHVAGTPCSNDS